MSAEKLTRALRDLAEEINAMAAKAIDDKDGPLFKKLDHTALGLQVLANIVGGKTVERAFGAPGDWGYGTPVGDGLLAMLQEPVPAPAITLDWHDVADELPDDDVSCLVAVEGDDSDEVNLGTYSDGTWYVEGPYNLAGRSVYAWCHAPAKPLKKGGAS
jgi:hypothetical protein